MKKGKIWILDMWSQILNSALLCETREIIQNQLVPAFLFDQGPIITAIYHYLLFN